MLSNRRADDLMQEVGALYELVLGIARSVNENDRALTATQRLVLIEVARTDALRPRELARRLRTTPATITRSVDALEDLRLVTRRTDPDDKRCQLVVATPAGRRWSERRGDQVRRTLAELPPSAAPKRLVDDLRRLNRALRHLTTESAEARDALRVH